MDAPYVLYAIVYCAHKPDSQHQPVHSSLADVLSFLRSVDSTLGSALDRFIAAGVISMERVLEVASWKSSEREAFLRSDVHLTAFECKIVSNHMSKLVS